MMNEILQGKIDELQKEHNRVCNALAEMKNSFDTLNNRRIELEGAMKEILEIMNLSTKQEVVDKNDPESEITQGTDSNKG